MFFHPSTVTKSQSNSISLSDWSLEDSPLPLYRKPVEHPDMHFIDSSVTPRFNKTYTIQSWLTMIFIDIFDTAK